MIETRTYKLELPLKQRHPEVTSLFWMRGGDVNHKQRKFIPTEYKIRLHTYNVCLAFQVIPKANGFHCFVFNALTLSSNQCTKCSSTMYENKIQTNDMMKNVKKNYGSWTSWRICFLPPKKHKQDYPGGTVDKESNCSAGDTGSIPGPGWSRHVSE